MLIQSIDKRRNKFKVVRVALFFLEYVLKHHGQNSVVSSGELPQQVLVLNKEFANLRDYGHLLDARVQPPNDVRFIGNAFDLLKRK